MKKFVQTIGTYEDSHVNPGIYKKMFLIMRLTMILMFFATIQVSATGYAQITVSAKNESMQKVFREIQKQSGYDFLYSYELLERAGKITVNINKATIEEAVNECIKGKELTFAVVDKTVVLKAKKELVQQPFEYTLKGKVTHLTGEPVAGVSVIIKNTSFGVVTDNEGKYTLNLPEKKAVIVFSFIGMKSKEMTFSGQKEINVILEDDVLEIDQAVVIGYGTTTKLEATDAMSSIDPKIFEENSASNITSILQGQIPGMLTMMGTGAPGEEALAIIRGVSTLNGNMGPLIVIDDIPMHDDFLLKDINPNDIKSINILKGASATSIYGSRGAAGVFMITTKGGLNTLPQVNYKLSYGINKLAEQMEVLNSDEFKQLFLEAIINRAKDESMMSNTGMLLDITTGSFGSKYYQGFINNQSYWGEAETDWLGAMYQPAINKSHNLLLTGNASGLGYSIGLGLTNDKGNVKKTGFDRKNLTIRIDSRQNKFFQFGTNVSGSLQNRDAPSVTLDKAMFMRPDLPIYDDNGSLYIPGRGVTAQYQNPMAELEGMDNNSKTLTYSISGYGQFNFTKDLSWKTLYSYSSTDSQSERYYGSKTLIGSNTFNPTLPRSGRLIRGENQRIKEEFDSRLSYNKTINQKNKINALLAYTTVTDSYYTFSQTYDDFPEDKVLNAPWYGLRRDIQPSGSMKESAMASYLGRFDYNYDDKYLSTLSYRIDGTSRMSPDSRYHGFPSIALAWNISEEGFMKKYNDLLKLLKLRASYGVMANASVPEYGWRTMFEAIKYDNQQGIRPLQLGNETLKWEMSYQYDIGLDFTLFNDSRLSGSLGYYRKDTKGALNTYDLPSSAGFVTSTTQANLLDITNQGIELDLMVRIINNKNINWTFLLNAAHNANKITRMDLDMKRLSKYATTILKVGQPIGLFYGYKTDGIFKSWEEVWRYQTMAGNVPYQGFHMAPGEIILKDLNGDGFVSNDITSPGTEEPDKTILGKTYPDIYGGFSTRFSWKSFTLSIQGNYSFGAQKYWKVMQSQFKFGDAYYGGSQNMNLLKLNMNRWTPDNPDAKYPKMLMNPRSMNGDFCRESTYIVHDYWLYDASFIKISNFAMSYSIPQPFLEKFIKIITKFDLAFSVNNLVTFTKYPGVNPESFDVGDRIAGPAMDNSAFPKYRTFNFSMNITFKTN